MQIKKENILLFLKDHKDELEQRFGVTKIALFGSYVRDEQKKDSDVDLLIETQDFSFRNRCNLKRFLEDSFKKKVDLCYLKGLRSFIRHAIKKELIYA